MYMYVFMYVLMYVCTIDSSLVLLFTECACAVAFTPYRSTPRPQSFQFKISDIMSSLLYTYLCFKHSPVLNFGL
jgi:hypothetical protein